MSSSNQNPQSFEQLAASRREWIDSVLRPWCMRANQKQLRQVAAEWLDIAGRVDLNATLWTWAWERFDDLTYPDLAGVNETREVRVTLRDGTIANGFPDSRKSVRGTLILMTCDLQTGHAVELGPFSIDDIASVTAIETH